MKTIKYLLLSTLIVISLDLYAQFGNALKFDGVVDYIEIEDNSAFDLTSDFTLELWIYGRQLTGTQMLIRKGNCYLSQNAYYLGLADGKIRVLWDSDGYCGGTPSYYESTDVVIMPGECYHIAVVHAASKIEIYVNNEYVPGELMAGSYGYAINSNAHLTLGNYIDMDGTPKLFFMGQMDEVRFWNYRLSQEQIESYSTAPLAGDEDGLVAYYDMEDVGVGTGISLVNKAVVSSIPDGLTHGTPSTPFFEPFDCSETNTIQTDDMSAITIFPNPTSGMITISTAINPEYIEIYSMDGQLIERSNYNRNIDLSKLAKGIYLIKLEGDDWHFIDRIVLQ